MSESLQSRPAYHEGFYDAQAGDPLFNDAARDYEAGWRAFYECKRILADDSMWAIRNPEET